jgi:hypothetical protein
MPLAQVDAISAPSARDTTSTNTNLLDAKRVKPIDVQGIYIPKHHDRGT